MTADKEVIEGNKLIAEFMNIPKCDRCDSDCGNYKFGSGNYCNSKDLQYHSSWDWQVPVWNKIHLAFLEILIIKPKDEVLRNHISELKDYYYSALNLNDAKRCHQIIITCIEWLKHFTKHSAQKGKGAV